MPPRSPTVSGSAASPNAPTHPRAPDADPAAPEAAAEALQATLREDHSTLLARAAQAGAADRATLAADIRAFMARVQQAGHDVSEAGTRRSLQQMLSYWQRELAATEPASAEDYALGRLGDYRDAQAGAGPEDEHWRERIRLAALARQWRESHHDGYLLVKGALAEAREYADDPDIADFVRASDESAARRHRRARLLWAAAAVAALVAALAAGVFLLRFENRILQQSNAELNEERNALEAKSETLRTALAEKQRIATEALVQREQDAARRTSEVQALTDFILRKALDGSIPFDELPEDVRAAAAILQRQGPALAPGPDDAEGDPTGAGLESHAEAAPAQAFDSGFDGYRPDFLPVEIPLPIAPGAVRLIAYAHHTLALDEARRLPLFTAVNLDRGAPLVLPPPAELAPDARLPPGLQPDPAWFAGDGAPVLLVAAPDIAWDEASAGEALLAADRVQRSVFVWPNALPARSPGDAATWASLGAAVRTTHNPAVPRVTILSGPILGPPAPDDPGRPLALWKIAVSAVQGDRSDPALSVDAFILPSGVAAEGFEPAFHKVPLVEIERRTGLDFGTTLRDQDEAGAGTQLLRRIAALGGPDAGPRREATQALVDALRDDAVAPAAQREAMAALILALEPDRFAALSPPGRANLAFILSEVPSDKWAQPSWVHLRSRAAAALADLRSPSLSGAAAPGPQARALLEAAEARLRPRPAPPAAAAPRPDVTVHLQFTVMPRWKAQQIRDDLRALGWRVPGEERVRQVGVNDIRYNPQREADARAARQIAADLAEAGYGSLKLVPLRIITPGTIEVWISAP